MSLRDNWKKTGTDLGHAFRDLGKTLIKTAAVGAEKVDRWANSDDNTTASAENVVEAEPVTTDASK